MSALGSHLGLVFLVLCLVAALALAALGILRVVRAGLHLRDRLAGYAKLPVERDVALAEARVAALQRRMTSVPALLARARAAILEIQAARARLALVFGTVSSMVRFARSFLSPG